jgi:glutathione S-transferase
MLTIYHVPGSRSVRTVWLAKELNIPHEVVSMPLDLRVLRAPDYLAVHPLGRVPSIREDDGQVVFESGALAQYLCWKYPAAGLGRDPGHPEWAQWLQWIHFAETLAVHGASLVQQTVFVPPDQRSPIIADLEGKRAIKAMQVLDRHLAERDYLLASGFSAADVNVGYSVHLAKGFVGLPNLPHVEAWYQSLAARPAFADAFAPMPAKEQAGA